MDITYRLLLKCITEEGAGLNNYHTWSCGDGCCSERQQTWEQSVDFNEEVEIDPEIHTWDGTDVDGFWVEPEVWEILEIPEGYVVKETHGNLIVVRPKGK